MTEWHCGGWSKKQALKHIAARTKLLLKLGDVLRHGLALILQLLHLPCHALHVQKLGNAIINLHATAGISQREEQGCQAIMASVPCTNQAKSIHRAGPNMSCLQVYCCANEISHTGAAQCCVGSVGGELYSNSKGQQPYRRHIAFHILCNSAPGISAKRGNLLLLLRLHGTATNDCPSCT